MKPFTILASVLGLVASTSAMPLEARDDDVQTVNLIFHGGPAQYEMSIPADGNAYETNNTLTVSVISAPDYNAYQQCAFDFATPEGQEAPTLASSISPEGVNQILVGPPQPVRSVRCEGMCVPTYGDCFRDGMWVGPCCAGYCAANKCRPWVPDY
ncbi:hypothetical protein VTK26DRAFT_8712 [Humicola hyalothermophila]